MSTSGDQTSPVGDGNTASLLEKFDNGVRLHRRGKRAEAEQLYIDVLRQDPNHFDALRLLGLIAIDTGRAQQGVALITKAIGLNANNALAHDNLAHGLSNLGRLKEAVASYDRAIALDPGSAPAHANRGLALLKLRRFEDALASCDTAVALACDNALIHNNRGWALIELKRFEEALASCDKAITLDRDCAPAHNNRGWALIELKRFEDALASCDKAIALVADNPMFHNNRGLALTSLRRFEDALVSYDKAIALDPELALPYDNRGRTYYLLKRFEEALRSYARAIEIKPDTDFLPGALLHTKGRMCDWSNYNSNVAGILNRILCNEKVVAPFQALALSNSPGLQRKASEIWVDARFPASRTLVEIAKPPAHQRIRIGHFSADFHHHATAFLMAELLERRNGSKFELTAFSFGPDTGDATRQRLKASFDRFIDVRGMSDRDVALLARNLEIDIGIDLKGFTEDARPTIFAMRAAPVQVDYLGYPGTMGASYVDYLMADSTIIPASHRSHYTEKIVYLPNTYQPNDRKREISTKAFKRSELGLPREGFVFCCFNSSYKIAPDVFESWMRILGRVEGSVLWLFADNEIAVGNLRKEASVRGIDANRLVFARRMALPDHLARHRAADLFLDTLPYNAHTTASDALWAGLPVLTQIGETFAGRVAASLLNAARLPELITTSRDAYEALAVEFAAHPAKLAFVKRKLDRDRLITPLFDSALFTKHIEAAYTMMYQRHQAGLPPDHLHVPQ